MFLNFLFNPQTLKINTLSYYLMKYDWLCSQTFVRVKSMLNVDQGRIWRGRESMFEPGRTREYPSCFSEIVAYCLLPQVEYVWTKKILFFMAFFSCYILLIYTLERGNKQGVAQLAKGGNGSPARSHTHTHLWPVMFP